MKNEQNNHRGSNTSTWQESVVEIKRVTKVVKGGKKLKFRVIAVVGDGKGFRQKINIQELSQKLGVIKSRFKEILENRMSRLASLGSALPPGGPPRRAARAPPC